MHLIVTNFYFHTVEDSSFVRLPHTIEYTEGSKHLAHFKHQPIMTQQIWDKPIAMVQGLSLNYKSKA